MYISWATKRQLLYFLFVLAVILALVIFIFIKATHPTCSDGRKNQGEQGIDCGGPCSKECLGEIKEPIILWSKALEVNSGNYDVVAIISNQNLFLTAPSVKYQFKLYDKNNILIAVKTGKTFINPGRRTAVFEANIDTGHRVPKHTFLEFERDIKWERYKENVSGMVVTKKEYSGSPQASLSATVANKSINDIENIRAVAVIYNEDGEAVAASASKIDSIAAGLSQEIFFTWPVLFGQANYSNEIFLSVDPSVSF